MSSYQRLVIAMELCAYGFADVRVVGKNIVFMSDDLVNGRLITKTTHCTNDGLTDGRIVGKTIDYIYICACCMFTLLHVMAIDCVNKIFSMQNACTIF